MLVSKIGKITVISLGLVLMIALPVLACGGSQVYPEDFIFSMLNMAIFSALSGYGLPLLAMLGIETWLLRKRENLPYWKSFLLTLSGNINYILTVLISWFWVMPLPFSLIASTICAVLSLTFCQRQGVWKNLSKSMYIFLVFLGWSTLGVASSFFMDHFTKSTPQPMLYLMTSIFILIGFLVGFVAKGSTIALFLRPKHPTFADTIMSMHICSYAIVPFAYLVLPPYYP